MMISELYPEVHKWPFLCMRSENMAKNCPKCCQIAKIVVAEKDDDSAAAVTSLRH